MLPIKEYLACPKTTAIVLLEHFGQWLPEQTYLKIMFRLELGYRLDLKAPKTFSEKIQWLKLYDRKPQYTTLVDKYAVKEYVAKKIGSKFIIPTLGIWDKPKEIDWDSLPDCFVLKTTHGGGSTGVVICKNKDTFNREKAVERLNASLKQDIYRYLKEWPYKDVPRRILAEKYITPQGGEGDLPDYKWYCFNGEPKYCQVIQNRTTKETIDFFDTNWVHQEFVGLNPTASQATVSPARPSSLEDQIIIARELSKDVPFSRVDLYESDGNIYFGEITFYPASGMGVFSPYQYNEILGQMIVLPTR